MGLWQSTMEVTQNENVLRESVNSYEGEIDQFKVKINQLDEFLDNLQTINSRNFEILKNYNLTKTILDENFQEAKSLLERIYTFLQEVKCNLNMYYAAFNGTFNDKTEHIKKLEKKCLDQIQSLEILERDKKIEISTVKTEQKEYTKILTENQNLNILENLESKINMVPSKKITRAREKNEKQETTDEDCQEVETNLRQAEIDHGKQTDELKCKFDLKRKIIKGNETEVLPFQANIKEMSDEIAHLTTQIAALKHEFISFSLTFECNEEKIIDKAIKQNQHRVNELNAKAIALNVEYQSIEKELKNTTLEIDNIKTKIRQLKASQGK